MQQLRCRQASWIAVSAAAVLVAAGVIGVCCQTQAADKSAPADASLSTFMRKKLEASSQILEGLTTEDSELIVKGAKALLEMSLAEKWKVVVDSDYRQHNIDYRNTVRKLADAAEKGRFDNAALQWFDTTKSCIECHHDVRHPNADKK